MFSPILNRKRRWKNIKQLNTVMFIIPNVKTFYHLLWSVCNNFYNLLTRCFLVADFLQLRTDRNTAVSTVTRNVSYILYECFDSISKHFFYRSLKEGGLKCDNKVLKVIKYYFTVLLFLLIWHFNIFREVWIIDWIKKCMTLLKRLSERRTLMEMGDFPLMK